MSPKVSPETTHGRPSAVPAPTAQGWWYLPVQWCYEHVLDCLTCPRVRKMMMQEEEMQQEMMQEEKMVMQEEEMVMQQEMMMQEMMGKGHSCHGVLSKFPQGQAGRRRE